MPVLLWKWIPGSYGRLFSESADPVVKGSGMDPMFLTPLKISEIAAPAFYDQLVLHVSRYSGIVTGHFSTPP